MDNDVMVPTEIGEAFMDALEAQYGDITMACLQDEWQYFGDGRMAIVWEEGPTGWAYYFPHGGRTDTGHKIPDVSGMLPKGYWAEVATGWAVSIWPA